MTVEQEVTVLQEFSRAMHVRKQLPPWFSTAKGEYIPSCHEIAHAYGEVFGLKVVDGEIAYIKDHRLIPAKFFREEKINVTCQFIKHSWLEFEAGYARFILDIFPETQVSVLPLMHRWPHPAYYVPDEPKHLLAFKEVLNTVEFKEAFELLVTEMKRTPIP
jgi:hypothetical protein